MIEAFPLLVMDFKAAPSQQADQLFLETHHKVQMKP
jgi:hypothetical protein